MKAPRDLATTLPSPSEMDNYHKCPCYWYLQDRLWIKAKRDKWPMLMGRLADAVLGKWLTKTCLHAGVVLEDFDALVMRYRPDSDEDYDEIAVSARDALVAWLTKYGKVSLDENIVAIQPRIDSFGARGKIDYITREDSGLVVRERKVVSAMANFEDEMARYELGFQPLCYHTLVEAQYKEPVSCVEFEFLFRSAPAKGKYKEKLAHAERGRVYVEAWKKDLWRNSAEFTNYCMRTLEDSLEGADLSAAFPFAMLPRHTRNCIQKFGAKSYPCDFYSCCKINMSPLLLPDYFEDGREKEIKGAE